jgi:hypothetical protein
LDVELPFEAVIHTEVTLKETRARNYGQTRE